MHLLFLLCPQLDEKTHSPFQRTWSWGQLSSVEFKWKNTCRFGDKVKRSEYVFLTLFFPIDNLDADEQEALEKGRLQNEGILCFREITGKASYQLGTSHMGALFMSISMGKKETFIKPLIFIQICLLQQETLS